MQHSVTSSGQIKQEKRWLQNIELLVFNFVPTSSSTSSSTTSSSKILK